MNQPDRDSAIELLRSAVTRSKRHEQVPFSSVFLRSTDDTRPPLARMIHGGQGGRVRLKLYLTITMMVTRSPHDLRSSPSPRYWARMFGMSDAAASRRITSNLRWLHDNKFISLTPRAGNVPQITLLESSGLGGPYVRPTSADTYISLPLDLWNQGWILKLSATELAFLMVIRDVQQAQDQPRYATRERHDSYHLSWDTWTRATKTLKDLELLEVTRIPQGGDFDYYRMRNLYRANLERLKTQPAW